jgi:hypothetical protein
MHHMVRGKQRGCKQAYQALAVTAAAAATDAAVGFDPHPERIRLQATPSCCICRPVLCRQQHMRSPNHERMLCLSCSFKCCQLHSNQKQYQRARKGFPVAYPSMLIACACFRPGRLQLLQLQHCKCTHNVPQQPPGEAVTSVLHECTQVAC